MWIVVKFEKKNLYFLKSNLLKKFGEDIKFYTPKLRLQKFKKNKLCDKESFLLGNYMLCFHKSFSDEKSINIIQYCKGVKYFLKGFLKSQVEIDEFVKKCKLYEDNKGFVKQSFFDFRDKSTFQFLSGPFTNMIFNVISENHYSFKALIGNLKTTVYKEDYIYRAV